MAALGGGSETEAYRGPYVSARDPAGRWLWITDGARTARTDRLDPSQPSRSAPPKALSVELDDETAERIIDSFRREAWGLDDGFDDEDDLAEDEAGGFIPAEEEKGGNAASAVASGDFDGETYPDVASRSPDLPALRDDRLRAGPQAVRVNVLGSVDVDGWQEAPSRAIVVELACYLALHPDRPIPSDQLRAALWPDGDREASAKSLRTYVSLLRRCLGGAHVPPATGAGYRLAATVTTDWAAFVRLTGTNADRSQLEEALGLVRGRPFASTPPGSFGWVYSELLVSEMESAIAGVARRLAVLCLDGDDAASAAAAVRRGLLAVPFDLDLWRLHVSLASDRGHGELERAQLEAKAALGELADDVLSGPIGA